MQDFSIYDIEVDAVNCFDISGYSIDNVYGISQENKKVIAKMKDEMDGQIISDFIAL